MGGGTVTEGEKTVSQPYIFFSMITATYYKKGDELSALGFHVY